MHISRFKSPKFVARVHVNKLSLFLFFPLFSFAQDCEYEPLRAGLTIEQDVLLDFYGLGKNRDMNYTMGLALSVESRKLESCFLYKPLHLFNKILGFNQQKYFLIGASLSYLNSTFTPQYLGNNQADSLYYMINDRPFASINYLSSRLIFSKDELQNKFISTSFNLGLLGTDLSYKAQSHIHREHWFGSIRPIPYGWTNQISDKGEPTMLLALKSDRLIFGKLDTIQKKAPIFQLSSSAEVRAGYYTNVSYGFNFRAGLLNPVNWNREFQYLSQSNAVVPVTASNGMRILPLEKRKQNEIFILGGLRSNVWAYNALLMGQFRDTFHSLSYSEIYPVTLDWNLGIASTIRLPKHKTINIAVTVAGRSPEFKAPSEFERWHSWAGFQLFFVN